MENLVDAVKTLKIKREEKGLSSLESLKAAYAKLLQKEKALEGYLDDNSVPVAMRESKVGEFKDILSRMNQLLMEIARTGYRATSEEMQNGFV